MIFKVRQIYGTRKASLFWANKSHIYNLQSFRTQSTIGIRRESKGKWERRAPLTPEAVSSLIKDSNGDIKFLVETCNKRIFSDEEYKKVGTNIIVEASNGNLGRGNDHKFSRKSRYYYGNKGSSH